MFKRFICWILRFVALVFGGPGETVPFAGCCDDHGNGYRQQAAPRPRARVTGTRKQGDGTRKASKETNQ